MRQSILILSLIFSVCAFAVEGFDPPRRRIHVQVQLDEDNPLLPSTIANLFEEPFQYFISQDTVRPQLNAGLFGGIYGVGGSGNLFASRYELGFLGKVDTLTTPHQHFFGYGKLDATINRKYLLFSTLTTKYGKREFQDWMPRFLGGRFDGKFIAPYSKTIFSAQYDITALQRDNYPMWVFYDKDWLMKTSKYRELTGFIGIRGHYSLFRRIGVFGEADYSFARRGENLIPQSAFSGSFGGFYTRLPFVAKLGVNGTKVKGEDELLIRPLAEFRWAGYPISAVISYGVNSKAYAAFNIVSDPIIDPTGLKVATIETIGVQVGYKTRNLSIIGSGSFAIAYDCPYIVPDTIYGYITHTDKMTIAKGIGTISYEDTIADFPFQNTLICIANRSKMPSGNSSPMIPKMIATDTISVLPLKWLKFWGSADYSSGFYLTDSVSSWKNSVHYFSCGVTAKWKSLVAELYSTNVTKRFIYEHPYFTHNKREIGLYVGIQQNF